MNFKLAWMASALMAFVGVFATGCGNACDDAADKLAECLNAGEAEAGEGECSGVSECVAECVNDASCEDITSGQQNSYTECVTKCGGS